MDLRETGCGEGWWIGFNWLRIGTGVDLLRVRWWTFKFLRHGLNFYSLPYCVVSNILHQKMNTKQITSRRNEAQERTYESFRYQA
jgi:hypothetical protein